MKPAFRVIPVALALLASGRSALAQSTDQKAAAEVLFNDAMTRMKRGDHAGACPKLEQSLAIDFAVGALARLAECHEKIGKTASAWAKYKEVASRAEQLGQVDRQRLAEQRATALEPKLSRLRVEGSAVSALPGVAVRRNGDPVPPALFDTDFPVDPGEQTLEVRAPGYEPATLRVNVPAGAGTTSARLPALVKSASATPAAATVPVAPTAEPPVSRADEPAADGSTQRVLGYVAAGAGVVGLGVGVGFYLQRGSKLSARDEACPDITHGCPSKTAQQTYESNQEDAKTASTISTAGFITGGVLAAGGLVLILTAPRQASTTSSLKVLPTAWCHGAGIWTEGRF